MTSPAPTTPPKVKIRTPPQSGRPLALTSFGLSLGPFVALALVYLGLSAQLLVSGYSVVRALLLILLFGSGVISDIAAIVTGVVALRRAWWYPPEQTGKAWAIAGLVIGIVVGVFLLCGVLYVLLWVALVVSCSGGSPGC